MNFRLRCQALLALPLLLLGVQPAMAVSFSGTFVQDDGYQFFTFTVAAPTSVTIQTTSFADNPSGGFVPYLHFWDASGVDLSGVEPTNANASATLNLPVAGTFYVGLTVANNVADSNNLPGGTPAPAIFTKYGAGNFTFNDYSCDGYGPAGPFYSSSCMQHTGAWALDFSGVDSASLWPTTAGVPEPGSLALGLAGAAAFARFGRRRVVNPA